MKVLYFHQHFSTPKGSAGIRSYAMARSLVKSGHEVTVVCGSYGVADTGLKETFVNGRRSGMVDGINIIEFELPYSNQLSFLKRIKVFLSFALKSVKLALVEDYDILFATSTPLTAAIPGIFARIFRNKRFIFEVRDLWPELPRAMGVIKNPVILFLLSVLEWLAYKTANRLIALSPGIKEGIVRIVADSKPVAMIPNGCDLDIFSSTSKWRPEQIAADDFIVLFAGTHGLANGLDAVLDAAAILVKDNVANIKFALIGEGGLKAHLQERTKKENLTNVIFLSPVNKEKLSALMNESDIGLQTLENIPAFYYGTSPNKFFDYLAAGLPVLNNYPGWISNLINEFKCGISVPPESPEAFALALKNISNNKIELKQMGLSAKALAKSQFDRELLSRQFVAQFELELSK